jgi:TonB family protein
VFDEVIRKAEPQRLVRRASFLAGSTAVQAVAAAVLASAITAMASGGPREVPHSVEVKFVKGAAREAMTSPPPAPRKAVRAPRPPTPPPVAPIFQPKKVPDRMVALDVAEPPPPGGPAEGPGVFGGVVGGTEAAAAPPPRPEFDAASMTRPVYVSGPDPTYTRAALAREVEGLMVVACVITREGLVRDCQVRTGLPLMDSAVVQALQRRRYRPATLRGEPIEVTYQFRLNFRVPR